MSGGRWKANSASPTKVSESAETAMNSGACARIISLLPSVAGSTSAVVTR